MDITILYLTGNLEEESFAEKIRQNILKLKGDIPIVSVSHKPMDFGKNICVGIQEPCYYSILRQAQIGLNEIKTTYVLNAEDDFLYSPEYFTFNPPESGHCYRYYNVWVSYYMGTVNRNPKFHFKGYVGGAQMIDKKLWLGHLNAILDGKEKWPSGNPGSKYIIPTDPSYTWTGNPIIDFKTRGNINRGTSLPKGIWAKKELPYWGTCIELRKRMFE